MKRQFHFDPHPVIALAGLRECTYPKYANLRPVITLVQIDSDPTSDGLLAGAVQQLEGMVR